MDDSTRVMDVPPDETGPVPVNISRAEARYYGVTPAMLALVVATAALTLAIVFFATGHWPLGLILLGVSLFLLLLFVEVVRRRPQGAVARSSAEVLDTFRARAGAAADSLATRGRAARQLIAMRRELQRMSAFRQHLLYELGDAVYRGDEDATQTARARIEELDSLAAQREAEMQQVMEMAERRLEQRRLEVQPTVIAEQPEQPSTPAPGEGNPPEPARIPEPYPPPDEGTPPQPAIIPEPGPAVIPEPGPQGGVEEGR
jgi:hypothetical protein